MKEEESACYYDGNPSDGKSNGIRDEDIPVIVLGRCGDDDCQRIAAGTGIGDDKDEEKEDDKEKKDAEDKEKDKETDKDKISDTDKEKDKEKDADKDKEKEEGKEKGKEKEGSKDKGKAKAEGKEKEGSKEKGKEKEGSKEKGKAKAEGKEKEESKEKGKEKEGGKEKGKAKEEGKEKEKEKEKEKKEKAIELPEAHVLGKSAETVGKGRSVIFKVPEEHKPVWSDIKIENPTNEKKTFKVKCTSNEHFRVQPPLGFIKPNETARIRVWFQNQKGIPTEKRKHYFAVYYMTAQEGKTVKDMWHKQAKQEGICRVFVSFEKATDDKSSKDAGK